MRGAVGAGAGGGGGGSGGGGGVSGGCLCFGCALSFILLPLISIFHHVKQI